jgi:predicted transglutaminase-like cysteine proteinase
MVKMPIPPIIAKHVAVVDEVAGAEPAMLVAVPVAVGISTWHRAGEMECATMTTNRRSHHLARKEPRLLIRITQRVGHATS